MPTDVQQCWNHNTHYYRHVLRALPSGARAALDVGTGHGLLARDLRERVPEVVAIDQDAACCLGRGPPAPTCDGCTGTS